MSKSFCYFLSEVGPVRSPKEVPKPVVEVPRMLGEITWGIEGGGCTILSGRRHLGSVDRPGEDDKELDSSNAFLFANSERRVASHVILSVSTLDP